MPGTTDGAPPEIHSEEELSRLHDAMYSAKKAGLDSYEVFQLAPDSMKMEFNYSKWEYREAKKD